MGASTPLVIISLVDSGGAFDPFRFLLIAVAGWMNQEQRQIVDYLREGNRPAYDGSVRRASGRPGMPAELAALVVRMASENRKLGLAEDTRRPIQSGTQRCPRYDR